MIAPRPGFLSADLDDAFVDKQTPRFFAEVNYCSSRGIVKRSGSPIASTSSAFVAPLENVPFLTSDSTASTVSDCLEAEAYLDAAGEMSAI